jgi:hypothetical protein
MTTPSSLLFVHKRPSPRRLLQFVGASAILALAGPIQAQTTYNWDAGAATANWLDAVNWNPDGTPSALDTAVFNAQTAQQTIQLGGVTPIEITALNFTANTATRYILQNGALTLNSLSQTADDANELAPTVPVSTKNSGADVLTVNVTSNSLGIQGQVTSGGLIKNGGSTLRLGTSGTAFNNAINGAIELNGGTLQASAAGTAGANNPLGGTGVGSNLININASNVTLQLTAQSNYNFVRSVVANNNSFTFRGDPSTGDPGDFQMTIGKITIGTATLTATTASGYFLRTTELALNPGATTTVVANNFLLADALSGDSATKIVKNGASDLRILSGTVANGNAVNFAGDFDVNQGWLVLESNAAGMQPLGNANTMINITNAANTPTVSLRANTATTFTNVNINAGNNNFNLDVRHLAGTNGAQTMQAGTVTIGNATMSVNGNDAFNARLAGIAVNSGATAILNVNSNGENVGGQSLRVDSLKGDATTTLRRDGGQPFTISAANNAEFLGRLIINGIGTNTIEGATDASPVLNSAGITFGTSTTLNLRSETALDFGAPINFGASVVNATIDVRRPAATGDNLLLRVGQIDLSGTVPPVGAIRNLSINQGNNYDLATDAIRLDAGQTSQLSVNTDVTADGLILGAGSTLIKQGGNPLFLTTDNSGTASGAILLRNGSITSTVAGSLGTGLVTVGDATPNTTGFIPNNTTLNWNAAGLSANATGVDVRILAGGMVDLNATPNTTDEFDVQAGGRIKGTTAQLGALTVGTNLTVGTDAIIVHENPSSAGNTVAGLANNANLFYGIGNNATSVPVIGVGTPWKGLSGEATSRNITDAAISINGGDNNVNTIEATLQSMFNSNLDFTGNYSFTSTAAGAEKVTLAINSPLGVGFGNGPGGLVILRRDGVASGLSTAVDKIIVQEGGLSVGALNALGGVPVEVQDRGLLDIANLVGDQLDGPVTIQSGGLFVFNDPQVLVGTQAITFQAGAKLDIGGAPATFFTDATKPIVFSGTGHTVRFTADEITNLDSAIPDAGAIFVVTSGAAATGPLADNFATTNIQDLSVNTQTAGLSTNGGVITNGSGNVGLNAPLTIGANGATFAATRNSTLVIGGAVNTSGDIQVGSLTPIDNRDKSSNAGALNGFGMPDPYNSGASVFFGNDFSADDVTVNNSNAGFLSANTTFTGNLTVNGGVLYLDGGGSSGGTSGELTPKLVAGTLADAVILGQYSRSEIKLNLASDTNATTLVVTQPFVIDGDVNPQDNRRLWVSRNTGTNSRVDFTNVTLNAGSAFAVDEDNTELRFGLKLAGNATFFRGSHDDVDILGITRDTSLPAFTGNNPAILTWGRLNQVGISGFQNANSNIFGTIGAGVQIDIIRGQLFFQPGSSLDGLVRTQTAGVGGDSFVVATSNSVLADTTIGGTGRIELGRSAAANGPEDLEIRGTEIASGTAPLMTLAATVRVVGDGAANIDGVIRSTRSNDTTVTARTALTNLEIASGATAQLSPQNSVPLAVGTTTLLGNATIDNTATGVTLTSVNGGAHTLTLQGAVAPIITNPITAGNLVVNGLTTTVAMNNIAGGLTVGANPGGAQSSGVAGTAGNVTATGNIAGALVVNASTASISGNVGGGLSVSTGQVNLTGVDTKTVTGPVALNGGNINVAGGVADFGTTVITSAATATVAGLRENRSFANVGNIDLTTANNSTVVKLGPVMAQTTAGWGSNETYTYTGEFFVPDNGTAGDNLGSFAFAENFDDVVNLRIDSTTYINNSTFNDATGSGEVTLPTGWHPFEVRLGQGGGGAGPVASDGWAATFGFGLDIAPPIDGSTTSPVQAQYVAPVDNGSMNLFRTNVGSNLLISAGSTLRAGGIVGTQRVAFSGSDGKLTLNAAGTSVSSTTDSVEVAAGSGIVEVTRAGDRLTVGELHLQGALSLRGAGDVIASGVGSGAGDVSVDGDGSLVVTGSISGDAIVNDGALRGSGAILGNVLATAGIVAPGGLADGTTAVLSTGGFNLMSGATLQIELGGTTAGTGYDQIRATGGGLSLAGNLQGSLINNFAIAGNQAFFIAVQDGAAPVGATFNGMAEGASVMIGGHNFTLTYQANFEAVGGPSLLGGNDVALAIPEPGSFVSLLGGFGMLAGLQRFRRRKA